MKRRKGRTYFLAADVLAAVFILLIGCLGTVDRQAAGPEGTVIGLASFNTAVRDAVGLNLGAYRATEILGDLALVTAAAFALLGAFQMVRRRSLLRVDRPLLALGGLFAGVFALYVLFELCVVNYRPFILPDETGPEASFPSSHTMLACVIYGGAALYLPYLPFRWDTGKLRLARAVCVVLAVVMAAGRFLSGVHWATDILGGVLISAALLCLYAGALEAMEP